MKFLSRLFGLRPVEFFRMSYTAVLPRYATDGASGLDLTADEDVVVPVLGRATVQTNVGIHLPRGFEAQIRARSGLAHKHGIGLVNGIGTIDSDYTGGLGVILFNGGDKPFVVKRGDRIAQLVIARYERIAPSFFGEIDENAPAEASRTGGFGSTGVAPLAAAGLAVASLTPSLATSAVLVSNAGNTNTITRAKPPSEFPIQNQIHAGSSAKEVLAFEGEVKSFLDALLTPAPTLPKAA